MKPALTLTLPALLLAACAGYGDMAPTRTHMGTLTNPDGMTLYVFDKDAAGKSNCNEQCAALWPPFMAKAGARAHGDYSLVTRDDGSTQWAYKGRPLYTWVKDTRPGDTSGDGVKNVWHVARP